jgi:hypothetical protein
MRPPPLRRVKTRPLPFHFSLTLIIYRHDAFTTHRHHPLPTTTTLAPPLLEREGSRNVERAQTARFCVVLALDDFFFFLFRFFFAIISVLYIIHEIATRTGRRLENGPKQCENY